MCIRDRDRRWKEEREKLKEKDSAKDWQAREDSTWKQHECEWNNAKSRQQWLRKKVLPVSSSVHQRNVPRDSTKTVLAPIPETLELPTAASLWKRCGTDETPSSGGSSAVACNGRTKDRHDNAFGLSVEMPMSTMPETKSNVVSVKPSPVSASLAVSTNHRDDALSLIHI